MGFFDFDEDEEDCCPNAEQTRIEVIRNGLANIPEAVDAFELAVLVEMHDEIVDNGGSIVHTARDRQRFRFDHRGNPHPVTDGGRVDGVSCAVSVCYRHPDNGWSPVG
ncbi:hypothetical protein [Streptomyces justiciae]|uniref:hypothetical protein n=1 Tax=Streptomyces justiciae TaxID=2780140 RepID=UPI002119A9C5|nr:hypothetical protein [Streptomyces justiciae]MCW8383974.1 hypothetical protein [Streptomyces justiciae]